MSTPAIAPIVVPQTQTAVVEAPAAAPVEKKSLKQKLTEQAEKLRAKIVADTDNYNSIVTTLQNFDAIESLAQGDVVAAKYGRAETARDVTGVVLGVNHTDTVTQIKIQVGAGFDTEILTINPQHITAVTKVASNVAQLADPLVGAVQ
jgi:hypothetical protein